MALSCYDGDSCVCFAVSVRQRVRVLGTWSLLVSKTSGSVSNYIVQTLVLSLFL